MAFNDKGANKTSASLLTTFGWLWSIDTSNKYVERVSTDYGIYPEAIRIVPTEFLAYINMKGRYASGSSRIIDGTYKTDVYLLSMPDGITIFDE